MFENNQKKSKESKSGRGGARVNAGRKQGATTKRTREIANKAIEEGVTPLEYMLSVMRAPEIKTEDVRLLIEQKNIKFEAAKAAAPYVHPRLAAVEVNANVNSTGGVLVVGSTMTPEQWAEAAKAQQAEITSAK